MPGGKGNKKRGGQGRGKVNTKKDAGSKTNSEGISPVDSVTQPATTLQPCPPSSSSPATEERHDMIEAGPLPSASTVITEERRKSLVGGRDQAASTSSAPVTAPPAGVSCALSPSSSLPVGPSISIPGAQPSLPGPPTPASSTPSAAPSGSTKERHSSQAHSNPAPSTSTLASTDNKRGVVAATRPDHGTKGQKVKLLANYYNLTMKFNEIYQYSIQIRDSSGSARIPKATARSVEQKIVRDYFSGHWPVFDGTSIMYSARRLPSDCHTFSVTDVSEGSRREGYSVEVELALSEVLPGTGVYSQQFIQALNVVMRENPARNTFPVGRSFFSPEVDGRHRVTNAPFLEGWLGYSHSVRETESGLSLNLDITADVFCKSMGVIEFLEAQFGRVFIEQQSNYRQVESVLRDLKVEVTHQNFRRKYTVKGLSDRILEQETFRKDDGTETTIVRHFWEKYGNDLKNRNLPCLKVGSGSTLLPMEACKLCPGQKYRPKRKDEADNIRDNVQNMTCYRPLDRAKVINKVMDDNKMSPARGDFVKHFQVDVDTNGMTALEGRWLNTPLLRYTNRAAKPVAVKVKPGKGSWNLGTGQQLLNGCVIHKWAVLNFDADHVEKNAVDYFIDFLLRRCKDLGVQVDAGPVMHRGVPSEQLESANKIEEHLRDMKQAFVCGSSSSSAAKRPTNCLLLCVMDSKKNRSYGDWKRLADIDVGITTQCCYLREGFRKQWSDNQWSQYTANLVLKINGKFGGQNVALDTEIPHLCPKLSKRAEGTIFFGADVTHPKKGEEGSSIAAVVASVDWPAATRYVARQSRQRGRQEVIEHLGECVEELWKCFYKENKAKPRNVVFFRDGVGERQFKEVLDQEFRIVEDALRRVGGDGYKPLITMVLAQKRHRTRLFKKTEDPHNLLNVDPGTVVDSGITHPTNFDFYLCSHYGIKGTSKPCHYYVLRDQIGFGSDELQTLIFHLCHIYARCCRSVSVVPPAFYAHLAAKRARYYPDTTTPGIIRLHADVQNTMFFL